MREHNGELIFKAFDHDARDALTEVILSAMREHLGRDVCEDDTGIILSALCTAAGVWFGLFVSANQFDDEGRAIDRIGSLYGTMMSKVARETVEHDKDV
jgi:hypothetical protein